MSNEKEFHIADLTIDDEYEVISSNASIKDAALKMKEAGIPDLVVIDKDDKVVGVIADFDIVTNIIAEGLSADTAKVTEVMYTIDSVTKDTPVSVAFSRMRDLDVSVIPVVENDELLGVATITDCWGYLPEKYEDLKGLIPVSNPRQFNYGFTVLMTLLYVFFGALAPAIGLVGFLKAPVVPSSGPEIATYYLFEARGGGSIYSYFTLQGDFGLLWLFLSVYGIAFLLLSIFSAFAIYQWAYADFHQIKLSRNWHQIGLIVGIGNLLIEWLLFMVILFLGAIRVSSAQIDLLGVIFGLLAIIFLAAAVSRDLLFREASSTATKEE